MIYLKADKNTQYRGPKRRQKNKREIKRDIQALPSTIKNISNSIIR